jgi:hypothetical protein
MEYAQQEVCGLRMTAGTAARFRVRHYHRDPRGWHGQSVRAGSQALSREACDAVTGARQDDPIQKNSPNRSSELPVPPTACLRRHYRTPALHLFLPTFFPACPSDAVEIVALHESVWRSDGLPRHGPGRLAMMGASVRFRVPAPKTGAPAIPAHPTRA